MSDEKFLGSSCFLVPRKLFILIIAAFIFVYGFTGILWAIAKQQLPGDEGATAWQAQDRCLGPRCRDVLTCRGTKTASFHTREVLTLIGHTVFGYWGFLGALHGYTDDLRWFSKYTFFFAVLLVALVAADGFYCVVCGDYTLNTIDEGLLWSLPQIPVREAVKTELHDAMSTYPIGFVNRLSQRNVFALYASVELIIAAFFYYVGQQAIELMIRLSGGELGMGAVYDLRDWKERVSLKRAGYDEYGYRSAA